MSNSNKRKDPKDEAKKSENLDQSNEGASGSGSTVLKDSKKKNACEKSSKSNDKGLKNKPAGAIDPRLLKDLSTYQPNSDQVERIKLKREKPLLIKSESEESEDSGVKIFVTSSSSHKAEESESDVGKKRATRKYTHTKTSAASASASSNIDVLKYPSFKERVNKVCEYSEVSLDENFRMNHYNRADDSSGEPYKSVLRPALVNALRALYMVEYVSKTSVLEHYHDEKLIQKTILIVQECRKTLSFRLEDNDIKYDEFFEESYTDKDYSPIFSARVANFEKFPLLASRLGIATLFFINLMNISFAHARLEACISYGEIAYNLAKKCFKKSKVEGSFTVFEHLIRQKVVPAIFYKLVYGKALCVDSDRTEINSCFQEYTRKLCLIPENLDQAKEPSKKFIPTMLHSPVRWIDGQLIWEIGCINSILKLSPENLITVPDLTYKADLAKNIFNYFKQREDSKNENLENNLKAWLEFRNTDVENISKSEYKHLTAMLCRHIASGLKVLSRLQKWDKCLISEDSSEESYDTRRKIFNKADSLFQEAIKFEEALRPNMDVKFYRDLIKDLYISRLMHLSDMMWEPLNIEGRKEVLANLSSIRNKATMTVTEGGADNKAVAALAAVLHMDYYHSMPRPWDGDEVKVNIACSIKIAFDSLKLEKDLLEALDILLSHAELEELLCERTREDFEKNTALDASTRIMKIISFAFPMILLHLCQNTEYEKLGEILFETNKFTCEDEMCELPQLFGQKLLISNYFCINRNILCGIKSESISYSKELFKIYSESFDAIPKLDFAGTDFFTNVSDENLHLNANFQKINQPSLGEMDSFPETGIIGPSEKGRAPNKKKPETLRVYASVKMSPRKGRTVKGAVVTKEPNEIHDCYNSKFAYIRCNDYELKKIESLMEKTPLTRPHSTLKQILLDIGRTLVQQSDLMTQGFVAKERKSHEDKNFDLCRKYKEIAKNVLKVHVTIKKRLHCRDFDLYALLSLLNEVGNLLNYPTCFYCANCKNLLKPKLEELYSARFLKATPRRKV